MCSSDLMISFILLLLGAVGPWALLVGLLVLIWRTPMLRGLRALFTRGSPLNDVPSGK